MENVTYSALVLGLLVLALVVTAAVTAWVTYRFVLAAQQMKARKGQNRALWEISPFERKHFNESSIKVDLAGLDPKSLIGVDLSLSEIISLSGATSGATVVAKYMSQKDWDNESTGVDRPYPGLYFDVSGPLIDPRAKQTVGIFQDTNGQAGLYLKDIFFVDSAAPGLAGRMLVRMARTSIDLGISTMELMAAGGRTWPNIVGSERWGGYLAWAVYGFDMHITAGTLALHKHFPYFPSNLSNCYTVQSVMELEGGRDFWRIVGDGWFMRFDASHSGSTSVKALLKQVMKKGV